MADDRREAGMAIRREMFGNEYVDAMETKRTPFNSDFRDFLAGTVYGTIVSVQVRGVRGALSPPE